MCEFTRCVRIGALDGLTAARPPTRKLASQTRGSTVFENWAGRSLLLKACGTRLAIVERRLLRRRELWHRKNAQTNHGETLGQGTGAAYQSRCATSSPAEHTTSGRTAGARTGQRLRIGCKPKPKCSRPECFAVGGMRHHGDRAQRSAIRWSTKHRMNRFRRAILQLGQTVPALKLWWKPS